MLKTLRYGRDVLTLPPDLSSWPVLDAPGLPALEDPERAFDQAAGEAAAWAGARAKARGRIAIIVPDRTRPLPLPRLLPALIRRFGALGIEASRLTVIPASGIHPPMSQSELEAWVGDETVSLGASLAPHDADAPARLLGHTPEGLPVAAHPAVARAAAVVALGRVVFHYLAGFGGGRKMLVPGVAARRSILAMHRRCLADEAGAGRHHAARAGRLEGNPVHLASSAMARLFPPTICLHLLLDTKGALAGVCAGDPFGDHEDATGLYADGLGVRLEAPLDAVVVSAGGYPVDRDLVQSHKALEAVAGVVRDGGSVLVIARCQDGIGNEEIRRGLALGDATAIDAALRERFAVGIHTALALREKTTRLRVLLCGELDGELATLAGIETVRSLEEGLARIEERHPTPARRALAPHGASLLYRLEERS